ncbi:uncharacterized protein LOC142626727 [Castanea sativa]|uniref:uncharacterized protein LOC142626727 n=1 Tax=Castanea sativa TaxID=21020 RepID=UPI003F6530A7
MIAALNRFTSRLADRCRPFYQLLKKWKGFQWMEECDVAFRGLKSYLASPPILSRLKSEEDLFLYSAVSNHAVSSVLIRQHERIQRPILLPQQNPSRCEDPSLLRRSNSMGRIAKLETKLGTFDIHYKPRNSIKGPVLADFVAEFTPSSRASLMICQVTVRRWKVYMDGASNTRGSGVGVVLVSLEGIKVKKSLRLGF